MEEINHRVPSEEVPNLLPIHVRLALTRPAMSSDDQDFGVRLAVLHQLDPLFDEALLRSFAWLPHHQVNSRGAEEQLVRGPINPLAAEVPAVQRNLRASVRI